MRAKPRFPRRVAAVFAASLLAVAACGGDDDEAGSTTAPSTETTAGGSTVPGETTEAGPTTAGPTTTAIAEEDLPPCPVDALAGADGTVEITVWHAMQADLGTTLVALTDEYNASQDKVRVTLLNQTGYVEIFDKYAAASQDDRPDLVQQAEYNTRTMADSQTIIPVQSCINAENYDTSDYLPRVLSYYTTEGALQSMPFNVSNPVLYYNKKLFVAAGLDPEKPPTTLEELRATSEAIVSSGAATYGLSIDTNADGGGGWYIEQWFAKAGILYANNENGRASRATEVLWTQPQGVEFMAFMQQMLNDGLAVNVGQNLDNISDLLKLADPNEPAAMTIHTTAALAGALNILRDGELFPGLAAEDLGIGPMPGPGSGVQVGGASMWLVADKDDEKTAASWDYLKFLTTAQSQSTWAAGTGYVPIRQSAVDMPPISDTYAADPRFKVAYDQLLLGEDTPASAGPVLGSQQEVRRVLATATERIFAGDDVASTLADAKTQADQILKEYDESVGG